MDRVLTIIGFVVLAATGVAATLTLLLMCALCMPNSNPEQYRVIRGWMIAFGAFGAAALVAGAALAATGRPWWGGLAAGGVPAGLVLVVLAYAIVVSAR